MQALVTTQFANTSSKVNGMQAKPSSGSSTAKKAAKGFLAILLSALSAWGA